MPSRRPLPGAQHGGEDQLLAFQRRRVDRGERCLDAARRQFEFAGYLVAEKQRDLAQKAA